MNSRQKMRHQNYSQIGTIILKVRLGSNVCTLFGFKTSVETRKPDGEPYCVKTVIFIGGDVFYSGCLWWCNCTGYCTNCREVLCKY